MSRGGAGQTVADGQPDGRAEAGMNAVAAAAASGTRNAGLDGLRALAALAVVAGHIRSFWFVDWEHLTLRTSTDYAFYFLTGLGHQAVIVFFVLSGYFVGGSVLGQILGSRWSTTQYVLRRLVRLEVVLLPALLLTLFWDHWGVAAAHGAGYDGRFAALLHSGPAADMPLRHDFASFAGNAAFLMTVSTAVYGSNGPLWSLANEFWYYTLFPLGCAVALAPGGWRVVAGAALAAIASRLPRDILEYGAIWLLGVAAWGAAGHAARRQWSASGAVFGLALAAPLPVLVAGRGGWLAPGFAADCVLGIACAVAVAALATRRGRGKATWLTVTAHRAADASYTLYLVHFPWLAFLWFTLAAPTRMTPGPASLAWFTALLAGACLYAAGVWYCFERNTDAVRRWIARRLRTDD